MIKGILYDNVVPWKSCSGTCTLHSSQCLDTVLLRVFACCENSVALERPSVCRRHRRFALTSDFCRKVSNRKSLVSRKLRHNSKIPRTLNCKDRRSACYFNRSAQELAALPTSSNTSSTTSPVEHHIHRFS